LALAGDLQRVLDWPRGRPPSPAAPYRRIRRPSEGPRLAQGQGTLARGDLPEDPAAGGPDQGAGPQGAGPPPPAARPRRPRRGRRGPACGGHGASRLEHPVTVRLAALPLSCPHALRFFLLGSSVGYPLEKLPLVVDEHTRKLMRFGVRGVFRLQPLFMFDPVQWFSYAGATRGPDHHHLDALMGARTPPRLSFAVFRTAVLEAT